jgi:V8-like Glu-specific endopeptidase
LLRAALAGVGAAIVAAATTTETIEPLPAIGRLDHAGHEDRYHCTATLIARDRAVTAAHCLDTPATVDNTYFRPAFAAIRGSEELRLRSWATASGRRDVAMLCLTTPAQTVPIPRGARGPALGEGLTVVGYAIPAERTQTHEGCTVDALHHDGTFVLNCPLRPGTSGAPVLRHTGTGREIVGVISATSNTQSLASDISGALALPDCE